VPRKHRYTVKQVAEALRKAAGLKAVAAKQLGCVPTTISNYISRHDELKEVETQCVENQLDIAESTLF